MKNLFCLTTWSFLIVSGNVAALTLECVVPPQNGGHGTRQVWEIKSPEWKSFSPEIMQSVMGPQPGHMKPTFIRLNMKTLALIVENGKNPNGSPRRAFGKCKMVIPTPQ